MFGTLLEEAIPILFSDQIVSLRLEMLLLKEFQEVKLVSKFNIS